MRLLSVVAAVATLATSSVYAHKHKHTHTHTRSAPAVAAPAPLAINGWYPCGFSQSYPDLDITNVTMIFQCATVQMPLCHDGICKSTKMIDVFVRRLLSTKKAATNKALWLLQGGPGGSSSAMESSMTNLFVLLKGEVDMYTYDHRGTGRSNFLECKAAQAFAAGGPNGVTAELLEMPNCISDIMHQIENKTEAFSVTSAAKDVELLTRGDLYSGAKDVQTFIYGVSYGTYVTERIMHLAPKHVHGYVLDGVVPEDNPSFTTTTLDQVPPAERLVAACANNKFCASKFPKELKQPGGLKAAWMALYDTLDKATAKNPNKCADIFRDPKYPMDPPSFALRSVLGGMGMSTAKRVMIPAVFYRVQRCADKDVAFLRLMFDIPDTSADATSTASVPPAAPVVLPTAYDQVGGDSSFLGTLIKMSEMWTTPSPSWATELKDFRAGLLSSGMREDFLAYCIATRAFSDPACTVLKTYYPTLNVTQLPFAPVFRYKPDAYFHKFAPIPPHASVVVINGKLDFQTLSDGGVREYKGLQGAASQKMLVEFEFGGHGVGISSSTFSDKSNCGLNIIASFVKASGKIAEVDTTCLAKVPAIDFADVAAFQTVIATLTSADQLYDADPKVFGAGHGLKLHKHHKQQTLHIHKHKHHAHSTN